MADIAFPQLLHDQRQAAGLTQTGLARTAHVSLPALRAYEQGKRRPDRPVVLRLTGALELDNGRTSDLLCAAGHEPLPDGPVTRFVPEHVDFADLKAEVGGTPWAVLVWDESAQIVSWNEQANRVAEWDFAECPQFDRNIMAMACLPRFDERLRNWDDVVLPMIENLRNGQIDMEDPSRMAYFTGLFEHLARAAPVGWSKLVGIWLSAKPSGHGSRIVVHPRWRLATGEMLRFHAVSREFSAADGTSFFEWHAADGATARWYAKAQFLEGVELPNLVRPRPIERTPGFVIQDVADWRATLRFARECAGLSQKQLAAAVGVSPRSIASYESRGNSQRKPPPNVLTAIANKLSLAGGSLNAICEELGYEPVLADWARFEAGTPQRSEAPRNSEHNIWRPNSRETASAIARHPFPCVVFDESSLRVVAANRTFLRATQGVFGRHGPKSLVSLILDLASAGRLLNAGELTDRFDAGVRNRMRTVFPVVLTTPRGAMPLNAVIARWNPFTHTLSMDWFGGTPEACDWLAALR